MYATSQQQSVSRQSDVARRNLLFSGLVLLEFDRPFLRTPWCKLPLLRVRVFFFWCLLAISFSLGTDGMLLALCDHGFERSG